MRFSNTGGRAWTYLKNKGKWAWDFSKRTAKVLLVMAFVGGIAFAGGMVGGLAVAGHFDGDGPERTEFVRNWNAAVAVILPDGRRASGVIVSRRGHVLTAAHVIEGTDGGQIRVEVDGTILEKTYNAEVVAVDEDGDLALLRIPVNYSSPAFIEMRDVPPYQGDDVYGIGFPSELDSGKTTNTGTVRILRMVSSNPEAPPAAFDTMVTSGRFEPGYSGGGIFLDRNGRLVGLVSMERWTGYNVLQLRSSPVIIPARRIRPFLALHDVPFNDPGPSWLDLQWRRLESEVTRLLN